MNVIHKKIAISFFAALISISVVSSLQADPRAELVKKFVSRLAKLSMETPSLASEAFCLHGRSALEFALREEIGSTLRGSPFLSQLEKIINGGDREQLSTFLRNDLNLYQQLSATGYLCETELRYLELLTMSEPSPSSPFSDQQSAAELMTMTEHPFGQIELDAPFIPIEFVDLSTKYLQPYESYRQGLKEASAMANDLISVAVIAPNGAISVYIGTRGLVRWLTHAKGEIGHHDDLARHLSREFDPKEGYQMMALAFYDGGEAGLFLRWVTPIFGNQTHWQSSQPGLKEVSSLREAILRLEEEGKLKLASDVSIYFMEERQAYWLFVRSGEKGLAGRPVKSSAQQP